MRSTTLHGTQVVRRTEGAVVGDHDELVGIGRFVGTERECDSVCRCRSRVFASLRHRSICSSHSGKITTWEILTPRSIAVLGVDSPLVRRGPGVWCHCNDSRVVLPGHPPGSNISTCPRVRSLSVRQLSLMEKRLGKPMLRRGRLLTSTSLSPMFSVRQQHLGGLCGAKGRRVATSTSPASSRRPGRACGRVLRVRQRSERTLVEARSSASTYIPPLGAGSGDPLMAASLRAWRIWVSIPSWCGLTPALAVLSPSTSRAASERRDDPGSNPLVPV